MPCIQVKRTTMKNYDEFDKWLEELIITNGITNY